MNRFWSRLHAAPVTIAVGLAIVLGALVGGPRPVAASCADLLTFDEAARLSGAAVFTGRAVREDEEYRVVFAVDRWFSGAHPARIVLFGDDLAGLIEEPEAGVIPAVLARTASGEGIGFVRDEPVIVTAMRRADGDYGPVICTEAPLSLTSPEGQAAVASATSLFGPGTPASELPATATLPDVAHTAGPSAAWPTVAAFIVALAGGLLVFGRRRAAATHRSPGRRRTAACLLVLGVLVAGGCGPATTSGSPAPASMPATTERATPTPTATPTSPPVTAQPAVTAPPRGFTVDCGPLPACLQVAAAAEPGLDVDSPPYTRVAVRPLDGLWTPPPAPSPPPGPAASPPVEVESFVVGYSVEFSWPSGSTVIPVFQGADGWVAGLPPAATRVYRFARDAGTWTELAPFELGRAEYALGGGCAGSGATAGGAVVVLQRVGNDESVLGEAARLRCGPTTPIEVFAKTLRLDAGLYRLAVEGATGSLEVHLAPVTAE